MARKKEPTGYFLKRNEFHEAQENMIGKLIVFMQAVDTALSLDQILPAAKPSMQEKLEALKKAVMSDE